MPPTNEQTPLLQERWSEEGEDRTVRVDVLRVRPNLGPTDIEYLAPSYRRSPERKQPTRMASMEQDGQRGRDRKHVECVCLNFGFGKVLIRLVLSPLVSSMFTPGIAQIAEDLNTTTTMVVGTTTAYVVMLGIGPLLLAPLSETFGRRNIYLTCFSVFALLQIPTGFAPNIGFLIAVRGVAGFFGSVGVANGGGTISDMFIPSERAGVRPTHSQTKTPGT